MAIDESPPKDSGELGWSFEGWMNLHNYKYLLDCVAELKSENEKYIRANIEVGKLNLDLQIENARLRDKLHAAGILDVD